jgi:hypothetical protein
LIAKDNYKPYWEPITLDETDTCPTLSASNINTLKNKIKNNSGAVWQCDTPLLTNSQTSITLYNCGQFCKFNNYVVTDINIPSNN